jgi:hypothetical protein
MVSGPLGEVSSASLLIFPEVEFDEAVVRRFATAGWVSLYEHSWFLDAMQ